MPVLNAKRRTIFSAALAAMAVLALLSILGAFGLSECAAALFNSPPLAVFWFLFAALLAAALFFRDFRRSPGLLAAHLGPLLVILGGMIGSDGGHALARKLFGVQKTPSGYMIIREGESSNTVTDDQGRVAAFLPFRLQLLNFRIEYYDPEDRGWVLAARVPPADPTAEPAAHVIERREGRTQPIPGTDISIEVLECAERAEGAPTVRVALTWRGIRREARLIPDGTQGAALLPLAHVFGALQTDGQRLSAREFATVISLAKPRGPVRDYISDLAVVEEGAAVAAKSIEVNRPLHYGGYHFYQHSYDTKGGEYTVLLVKSDSGLTLVYAGFVLLCAGVFWQLWLKPARARLQERQRNAD